MGSFVGVCSQSLMESFVENALWHYNQAREHDGLPPLSEMPDNTSYKPL